MDEVDGMPVYKTEYGDIEGLPPESAGTVYLVSRLVLDALQGTRSDVFAPGQAVRDETGKVIGCRGFSC